MAQCGLLQLSTRPRDPLEAGPGQLVQEASPVGSLWVGDKRGQVSNTRWHFRAYSPSPGQRRRGDEQGCLNPVPVMLRNALQAGRDRAGRARERLPPNGCSSSNGAREAREWIERRGGPTSDSLQLRACIRARPMECRDRETSNRPCWRLLSLAELDNRW